MAEPRFEAALMTHMRALSALGPRPAASEAEGRAAELVRALRWPRCPWTTFASTPFPRRRPPAGRPSPAGRRCCRAAAGRGRPARQAAGRRVHAGRRLGAQHRASGADGAAGHGRNGHEPQRHRPHPFAGAHAPLPLSDRPSRLRSRPDDAAAARRPPDAPAHHRPAWACC
jgi:hypothetical protein